MSRSKKVKLSNKSKIFGHVKPFEKLGQILTQIFLVLNRWTTVRMKYAGKKSCRLAAKN